MSDYLGRFAPSPTGPLHFGSMFTAFAGFVRARAVRGRWLLRIDDLDPPRTVPGAAGEILATLEAFGLHWDGEVLYQSQRRDAYLSALAVLQAQGLIYRCGCSRKDLASTDRAGLYPGTCRKRPGSPRAEEFALRVNTDGALIEFEDELQGPQRQNLPREVGDFIVFRRDRVVAYHLATVVDDAEMGVTEVFRGADLLDSSARQIFLQRALGLPPTAQAHIPVLVDAGGQKLSKQTHAAPVSAKNPAKVLFRLLELMGQAPEPELEDARVQEILDWAIAHWDAGRLMGRKSIPLHEETAPAD